MEKMLNVVLFGPPGAGKGTQSQNLIDKYGLVHLSTGDILRSEIAKGSRLGREAKAIMDRGELVGDDIVIGMIETKIDENAKSKGFIFDGFPRTIAQAVALDDLLQKKGTGISAMLALEVEDEELVKRLLLRGKDSGRTDDQNEDIIRRRIKEYNDKTLPLKKYYSEQGKFHSIHGIGSIDQIFKLLVDRITFLNAEMDLTALETDLEHLDLTISDYDEADEIAPELLLEIDAIKRAEAEEEEEDKQGRIKSTKSKSRSFTAKSTNSKPKAGSSKKSAGPKKAVKPAAKQPAKKNSAGRKKTSVSKPAKKIKLAVKARKAAKKTKSASSRKAVKKKAVAKKVRKTLAGKRR
jgi:adenylate kinase